MVGPGEVDDDLEPETAEECSKYGEVDKCVIFEVLLYKVDIFYVNSIASAFLPLNLGEIIAREDKKPPTLIQKSCAIAKI